MSEIVENMSQQNSAQTKEAAALPTESVEDVTTNNVEAAVKAVPEAVDTNSSATIENANDTGSKESATKSTSPKVDTKKTPVKRTPSKRMSYIERAQKESEELVKNMGGSLEIEGGRRTRSSTRGTPTRSAAAATPPPAKKGRTSPASGASTPTRPRGRGRKIDVTDDAAEEEENKPTPNKKKTPVKLTKAAAKDNLAEAEKKPVEANEVEHKSEEKGDNKGSTKSKVVPEEAKDATDAIEQPEEDKTDAVLETVVEESLSQVAADSLTAEKNVTIKPKNISGPTEIPSEVSESIKSDSPMDTEDPKLAESATEKNIDTPEGAVKEVATTPQVVKEPTPEPMEIDSSPSVNDDVVEINDDTESVKILENHEPTVEPAIANASESNAAVPLSDIVSNNSIAKPAVPADANEINTEENTPAANDLNKAENDSCEPKIATSPPISASTDNSTVTTPQTCN